MAVMADKATITIQFEPEGLAILERIATALEAQKPKPAAPKAKKAEAKNPDPRTPQIALLFEEGYVIFAKNGSTGKDLLSDASRRNQYAAIRLMLERDGISENHIKAGLRFLEALSDAGGKWPGWGKNIRCWTKFREKWNDENCGFRCKVLDAKSSGASIDDGKTVTPEGSGY